jgi:hypothetical protein
MPESDNNRAEKTTTETRPAGNGQNVRTVLVASLIAAILLLILIAAISMH